MVVAADANPPFTTIDHPLSVVSPPDGFLYYDADIEAIPSGEFLIATSSLSPISGNKFSMEHAGNKENGDVWVFKINSQGVKIWEESYNPYIMNSGATGIGVRAEARSLKIMRDGSFLIAGSTMILGELYIERPKDEYVVESVNESYIWSMIFRCDPQGVLQWNQELKPVTNNNLIRNSYSEFADIETLNSTEIVVGGTVVYESKYGTSGKGAQYHLATFQLSNGTITSQRFIGEATSENYLSDIEVTDEHILVLGESAYGGNFNQCSDEGQYIPLIRPRGFRSVESNPSPTVWSSYNNWIVCLAKSDLMGAQLWDLTVPNVNAQETLHFNETSIKKRNTEPGYYAGGLAFRMIGNVKPTSNNTAVVIDGPTSLCLGQTATYSVNSALAINWMVSGGLEILSTTSLTVTVRKFLPMGGKVFGKIEDTFIQELCVSDAEIDLSVDDINGPWGICPMDGANYTIDPVVGATSYTWQAVKLDGSPALDITLFPNGTSCFVERIQQQGTDSQFRVKVKANGNCSSGNFQTKIISKWAWSDPNCNGNDMEQSLFTNNSIKIYPNPVKNNITLDYQPIHQSKIIVKNSVGEILLTIPFTNELNTTSLPKGTYYLIIQDGKNVVTHRFVKE